MNTSSLAALLISFTSAAWAGSTDAFEAVGSNSGSLEMKKALYEPRRERSGMVLMAGPVSTEAESNPFFAFLQHKLRKRHHRRHRIHRSPQFVLIPDMESHSSLNNQPKPLLEVMKIRERIVVDENNQPKSAELSLSNDLMQVDPISGQVKMLRHGEIHIKPKRSFSGDVKNREELKTGAGLIKSVGPERTFIAAEFGADGQPIMMPQEGSRLDRFIRFLHLDQFWPLLFFSAVCGFSFVGLTFLAAKLILGLIDDNERDSYEPVPTDGNLLNSIESAQPIKITNEMIEVNENTTLKFDE